MNYSKHVLELYFDRYAVMIWRISNQFNFEKTSWTKQKFAIDLRREENIESSYYEIAKCTSVGYRWPLVGLISENQTRNRNKKNQFKILYICLMSVCRCGYVRMRMLLFVDIERLCAIIYRQWRHQRNTSDKSRTNILQYVHDNPYMLRKCTRKHRI